MSTKILFIFLDGFGLGKKEAHNPFLQAYMPTIHNIIDGPLFNTITTIKPEILLKGIDACLGVKGIPQSATGQTALLTGINAPQVLGYHLPAFPNKKLIEIIAKHNIYKQVISLGKKALFANSYSSSYFEMVKQKKRRHSVTTYCVLKAGLEFRNLQHLKQGCAVHWDITRHMLNQYITESIPIISPEQGGKDLAQICLDWDLVVFESFLPDLIGHSKNQARAISFLAMIDRFIKGILDNITSEVTVVISSDHGNIEDLSTGNHTLNPVPLLVIGKAASFFCKAEAITDVVTCIVQALKEETLRYQDTKYH